MREKLTIALLSLVTTVFLLVIGVVLLFAFWKFQPVDKPYISWENDTHIAAYIGNNLIAVNRSFKITKNVDLVVEREFLLKMVDDVLVRIEAPSTTASYEPGDYRTQRLFVIPSGLPDGTYEMRNKVCWQQNPIRRNCIDLPPLTIEYKK